MNKIQEKVVEFYEKANIVITREEKERIEIADFGLGDLWVSGAIGAVPCD